MRRPVWIACLLILLPFAGCAQPPNLPPVPSYTAAQLEAVRFRTVLVAGDNSLPVFDHAVDAMAAFLQSRGDTSITRLSATPSVFAHEGVRSATLDHVLSAISHMNPGPGEGCLVFATSHGGFARGLALTASGTEFLTPGALDRALARGCGNAPTVVVASGCFSGTFAQPPMTRANRIVLTAAAADRTSFGCSADRDLTFYDECLLPSLAEGGTWPAAQDRAAACVSAMEQQQHVRPSHPQEWVGPAVADFPLPHGAAPRSKRPA